MRRRNSMLGAESAWVSCDRRTRPIAGYRLRRRRVPDVEYRFDERDTAELHRTQPRLSSPTAYAVALNDVPVGDHAGAEHALARSPQGHFRWHQPHAVGRPKCANPTRRLPGLGLEGCRPGTRAEMTGVPSLPPGTLLVGKFRIERLDRLSHPGELNPRPTVYETVALPLS